MQYKNDEQANFPFEISRTHKVNGRETNACDANDMKCTGQMMNMSGKIVVFKDVCCFFVCVLLTELFCWLAYGFNRWSVCAWRVCVCVYVIESVPFVIHFHTTPTQLNQLSIHICVSVQCICGDFCCYNLVVCFHLFRCSPVQSGMRMHK